MLVGLSVAEVTALQANADVSADGGTIIGVVDFYCRCLGLIDSSLTSIVKMVICN
jgi:hypothetical protein